MKNISHIRTCITAITLALCAAATSSILRAQESPDPYASETPAQRDARMAWWREARFGMFIHWGVYSVPAGTYNGQKIKGLGEWIMCEGKIPMAEYQNFAVQFNPTNYNADEWVKLAKEAGMKYIVITAKHHDGFANFATKADKWNIVDATPYGKDVLQPLAAACRKYGLKLGFYYSQAQDWNNGGAEMRGAWDPAQKHDMDDYIDKIAVPQIKELLSNYGEFPSVIWWDTPHDMNKERAEKIVSLLKMKPGVIYNNRLGGGYKGDTETPEQRIPATGLPGRDWETCMTINDTWGFKSYDHHWKSSTNIIRNLVDIASKGGNYLLNVGPDSTGLIPAPEAERLQAVGKWMKVNGECIYGTTATPFGEELGKAVKAKDGYGSDTTVSSANNWRCTSKSGKSYVIIFNWPADGTFEIPALKSKIIKASLLADPKQSIAVKQSDQGITLLLPAQAPDPVASVVRLELEQSASSAK